MEKGCFLALTSYVNTVIYHNVEELYAKKCTNIFWFVQARIKTK